MSETNQTGQAYFNHANELVQPGQYVSTFRPDGPATGEQTEPPAEAPSGSSETPQAPETGGEGDDGKKGAKAEK